LILTKSDKEERQRRETEMKKVKKIGVLALIILLQPLVAGNPAIAADMAMDSVTGEVADMTGIWIRSNRSLPGNLDENFERLEPEDFLNEQGLQATAVVRPAFDPSALCLPSIPRHLAGPYPIEIIQNESRVVQLFEYDNVFRIIYTDGREHPDPVEDQRFMGHAIAQWDKGTLIVDTQNFNGKAWLSLDGIPVSENAHLTEWYSLIDNGETLEVNIRYEDPDYLKRPIWRKYFFNLKTDWSIREYLCAEGNRDNIFSQQEGLPGAFQAEDVLPSE
tara:strand:+ start:21353 stop:22180 length:828 start_codon:yes stop_codon:yes gene_type:complete